MAMLSAVGIAAVLGWIFKDEIAAAIEAEAYTIAEEETTDD